MFAVFFIGALLLGSSAVLAQEGRLIEEIMVTAQRIEENAQKVPIAISAFDEAMIEDRQIVGIADLQIFVPNLSATTNDLSDANFSIRGIGSLVSLNDAESGVSLHMNEIPLAAGQPPIELYDVQRIEVLRGPQGTLYGRNATGGVINLITNKPTFDGTSGYLDAELGDYDRRRLRGAFNFVVNDSLAVRVAGLYLERGGFTENLAGGQVPGVASDLDGRDLYGVRATTTWRISERTEAWFSYEKFDEDDDRMFTHNFICKTSPVPADRCVPGVFALEPAHPTTFVIGTTPADLGVISPLGAGTAETGLRYEYPRPTLGSLRELHIDFEPEYRLDQDIWQFGFRHDFERAELSIAAGYQEWVWHAASDGDWSVGADLNPTAANPSGLWPVSAFPGGVDALSAPGCEAELSRAGVEGGCILDALPRVFGYGEQDEEAEQWSMEVKLRSSLDGPLNFLVGANYQASSAHSLSVASNNLRELSTNPGPIFRSYPGFSASESKPEFDSYSAFAELYAGLSEQLELTVGVRYNRDEKQIADRILFESAIDFQPFVGGAFGATPTWVRTEFFPEAATGDLNALSPRSRALLDLYGATEAASAALVILAETGNSVPGLAALALVPPVPVLNEERLINGTPTKQTWDAWSGRLGLDWQLRDDILLYASYARGYKPGGFNSNTNILDLVAVEQGFFIYEREDVDNFEVGIKSLWLDGNLRLNASAFFSDYQDLQIGNLEIDRRTLGSSNSNVDAEIYGAELEALWRPAFAPRAELELGYSWLETKITDAPPQVDPFNLTAGDPGLVVLNALNEGVQPYVARVDEVLPWVGPAIASFQAIGPARAPAAQYPNGIPAWFSRGFLEAVGVETSNGVPIAIEGNRIPEAPKHRIHLAASYTWDVAGGSLTARWDYYWQDNFFTRAYNQDFDKVASWDQHNAALIYESADNRWSLRAWVRNIEDDVHITGGQRTIARAFAVSEPRAYGASVRYNFGSL